MAVIEIFRKCELRDFLKVWNITEVFRNFQ